MEQINIFVIGVLALAFRQVYQTKNVSVVETSSHTWLFTRLTETISAILLIGMAMYQYRFRLSLYTGMDESNCLQISILGIYGAMLIVVWFGPKLYDKVFRRDNEGWADLLEETSEVKSSKNSQI